MRQTNPNFMNGVPELLVLRLLRRNEMYGYELVQAIRDQTNSVITFGEGVVYPVLHGLEREGALTAKRKSVEGRSRVYYSITPAGLARLGMLSDHWSRLTDAIKIVLQGPHHVDDIASSVP